MKRAATFLLGAVCLLGCEGREVPVFELPARVIGGAGGGGQGGGGGTASLTDAGNAGSSAGTLTSAGAPVGGTDAVGGSGGAAGQGPLTQGGVAGAPVTMTATPCTSKADCQPGWVCDKKGCDASAVGSCVPWPPFCDPMPKPVCGCDGVTYWNDCLRLNADNPTGVAGPDRCGNTACTCETGADCNVPYASCSHLLPPGAMCGHGMGACWVLPPKCDPSADPKRWRECKPPPDGSAPACLDTCSAIATEHSYAELHRDETCP
jgi:hypothetical protein